MITFAPPAGPILTVNVEEQPTGELSVGAGFSSVDAVVVNQGVVGGTLRRDHLAESSRR